MTDAYLKLDLDTVTTFLTQGIPHCRALGVEASAVRGREIEIKLDYQPQQVGNPLTGFLHGGVITTLIDTVGGLAVFAAVQKMVPIATLDLRIDYLKPTTPEKTLYAAAECYKLTRSIAFVRGSAYHDNADDPIASCAAAFMVGSGGLAPGSNVIGKEGAA